MNTNPINRPTTNKFLDTCRKEFSFLKKFDFKEIQQDDNRGRFKISFKNSEYVVTIEGINYGANVTVSLFDINGNEALPIDITPKAERQIYQQLMQRASSQLEQIILNAKLISEQCAGIFQGNHDKFKVAANEWRRMKDKEYARSLQKRKLP